MSSQNVKGQEVSISLVRDDVPEDTLTNITDFEWTDALEIISKGYLGQTTEQKDMIYKGVKFSLKLHIFRQAYFDFRQGVINIARRVTPDSQVVIAGVLNMPSGETPDFTIPDAQFGNLPHNIAGREAYVEIQLQGEASEMLVSKS